MIDRQSPTVSLSVAQGAVVRSAGGGLRPGRIAGAHGGGKCHDDAAAPFGLLDDGAREPAR
jgi:hypothetical protein